MDDESGSPFWVIQPATEPDAHHPDRVCISFCPLFTHPQESCDSSLVLQALTQSPNGEEPECSFQKRVCVLTEQS